MLHHWKTTVRVAQWILRLPTEQEIPSSNLGMDFDNVQGGKVQSGQREQRS